MSNLAYFSDEEEEESGDESNHESEGEQSESPEQDELVLVDEQLERRNTGPGQHLRVLQVSEMFKKCPYCYAVNHVGSVLV